MTNPSGDLHDERKDYTLGELNRKSLLEDPLQLFGEWMDTARQANIIDATAMTLATVDKSGAPSARIVLLKQFTENGFYWYTSYDSRKGQELESNPKAALLFYWRELERQVRIEGTVGKATEKESDDYFLQRPTGSQFSAAASPQSQVIENQQWLTDRTNTLQQQYKDKPLPRPANWGGYCLQPFSYEFWQGRPSRQHDRFRFTREDTNRWTIARLAP